jgi:N-acetylglucosamine malate deacetylase 1
MEPLDVLAVMAHPDDAELLCGGALLVSSDRGERTGILDLTEGEMGSKGTASLRKEEAERASDILGLAVRRSAGLPDAGLRNTEEARRRVAGLLRELRPRVIVTHWIQGRHPDHREAAQLVYDASFLAGLKHFDAPGSPHRPRSVIHSLTFREDAPAPSFVVDITDTIERKLDALRCYSSQFEGVSGVGEVYPGGDRPVLDQIRVHAARDGARIRVAYGESFWIREALLLPTLGSLDVSTF